MKGKDRAYIMGFATNDGEVYSAHPTDDIESAESIEFVWFHYTLPHSCFIFNWRRDGKKFTQAEAEELRKFVVWNLDEGAGEFEGYDDNLSEEAPKITKKLIDGNHCLVLALDEMVLPDTYDTWSWFLDDIKEQVEQELESIKKGNSMHDAELSIYRGDFQSMSDKTDAR